MAEKAASREELLGRLILSLDDLRRHARHDGLIAAADALDDAFDACIAERITLMTSKAP